MKIGIIGGNGVAATNRLLDMIERKGTANGAYRDAHHPELFVCYATQSPSRSMYLEGRGPSFVEGYIDLAREMKRLGCNKGCICCNTAHYAIEEIERESALPFINVLEEVVLKVKSSGNRRFELFATDGARKFDLYGKAFRSIFPEAEISYPSAERQSLVTQVICDVKNKRRLLPFSDDMSPFNVLSKLIAEAKYPVILGCTDLRVALPPNEDVSIKVAADSLECLADAILRESRAA